MIQLHGDEGPSFCQEVARRTGCKVIKALRVRSTADIQAAEAFRTDYHLFDAHRPGTPGRHRGELRLGAARRRGAREVPMILAGGLDPDNVAEAIEVARPDAVDVASGIEAAPGVKDHALMAAFAEAAGVATATRDRAVSGAGGRRAARASASRSASAPTAAASSPRSWSPRSTSSPRPGREARADAEFSDRARRACCATSSAARRRSTSPSASRSASAVAST